MVVALVLLSALVCTSAMLVSLFKLSPSLLVAYHMKTHCLIRVTLISSVIFWNKIIFGIKCIIQIVQISQLFNVWLRKYLSALVFI